MNYTERVDYVYHILTWEFEHGIKATMRTCPWREGKPYSLALEGFLCSIPLDLLVCMQARHAELCATNWVKPKNPEEELEED